MRVLKYVALGWVGLLLFFALPLLAFSFTLNSTAFNAQFIVDEAQKLDVVSIGRDIILEKLPPAAKPYMSAIDRTIAENRPWIDEQVGNIIYGAYDYLEGKTADLSVTIPIDPVKRSLVDNVLLLYLPQTPEYQKLPDNKRKEYMANVREVFLEMVPYTIEINQDFIGAETMDTLRQMRGIMGYFRTGYPGLIALTLVLILLVILIRREVQGATRSLGIIFFLGGAAGLAGYFILGEVFAPAVTPADMLPRVQDLIPVLVRDILSPLEIFAVALLGAGGVLIAVSFLFIRRRPVPVSLPVAPSPRRYP